MKKISMNYISDNSHLGKLNFCLFSGIIKGLNPLKMKNLIKISREITTKFCWQEMSSFSSEKNETTKKITLNEEGKTKKETLNNQESINRSLSAVSVGVETMPNGFEKIPASAFLSRSAEELQTLFIVDGVVDFRGNLAAKRELGLVDLFPKMSEKQQFVVLNGINYAYGARRNDGKIGYGNPNYKAITGGETIAHLVAEKNSQSFVTNDKDQTQKPPAYEHFAGFDVDYLDDMEKNNLTPEQETEEKRDFLSITKNRENLQKTSHLDFKEMIEGKSTLELLKQSIAQGEGNYESHNNGKAGISGEIPGGRKLTDLTLREIMQYQQKPNRKLFAVGKYQFIPATLAESVKYTGINIDTKFSIQTQESLFPYLISAQKRPLLNAYLMGKLTGSHYLKKAHKELSLEFASISGPDGRGSYDGIAGNMASNNSAKISSILEQINEESLT